MIDSTSLTLHVGVGAHVMSLLALGQYSEALVLLKEAALDIINGTVMDGGSRSSPCGMRQKKLSMMKSRSMHIYTLSET
jgi:hypothetical protein